METLKHECGIAMIRLLKPLEYYKEKYGTYSWALGRLYLLMEKQHNRGQEAAGIGVVKLKARPGSEYVFRERALGADAIQKIFGTIKPELDKIQEDKLSPREVEEEAPFVGEIYMGHLRYSTTGKSGMSYVHPFLRRNNWPSRNLLLCGNFNLTNVEEIFSHVVDKGQHPRIYSDTVMLLEQLGYALDRENHRIYRKYRNHLKEPFLTQKIESEISLKNVLEATAPLWDGGFVICGVTGSGDCFALRDSKGIRPAFYYHDDEIVVIASERPVIQTVFDVARKDIRELEPGSAITVARNGNILIEKILDTDRFSKCSFERIYFSRGSDADIYKERKKLGRNLVPQILENINYDFDKTVFSFIPNTAEVAFLGMVEGLEYHLEEKKKSEILKLLESDSITRNDLDKIFARRLRIEKIAIKDIKLRTFISEGDSRNDMATHVYDVTYGCVTNNEDSLVVLDDSIVRGTTLKQSILKILDRLHPKNIFVVSSSPQVRYPDYYGIDMSSLEEFAAFRAAVELIKEKGMSDLLKTVYEECRAMESAENAELKNCVKSIYLPFTPDEISNKMARMLKPEGIKAKVKLIFQTMEGLESSIPDHSGDWYFSGNYPTPGGIRLVNRAYIKYYEKNFMI
ncbi:MAG: amidophosphoribosyltransferase [Muribaculaceae bacterium]|nr:amidophosphoribosyltransferase [Muribaculaceae bacterium]